MRGRIPLCAALTAGGAAILFAGAAGATTGLGAPTGYGTGAAPSGVAIADLDDDGRADLVVTQSSANRVDVLRGRSDGTFAGAVGFATRYNPAAVRIADMDGDGRPDVVVANAQNGPGGGSIGVYRNTGGPGLLAAATYYDTGTQPVALDVADLDGDGRPDVVTANQGADSVSVMTATGSGFSRLDTAVGAEPAGVVVADVNSDGRPDIATADRADGTVTLLTRGLTGYARHTIALGAVDPTGISTADLDQDGTPDLAVSTFDAQQTKVVLEPAASGTPLVRTSTQGNKGRALATGDLDADGSPDIAVVGQGPDVVSILHGDGAGAFAAPETYPTGRTALAVALGDVDGDGVADVVTTSYSTGQTDVLHNTARATPVPARPTTTTTSATRAPPPPTRTTTAPTTTPATSTVAAAPAVPARTPRRLRTTSPAPRRSTATATPPPVPPTGTAATATAPRDRSARPAREFTTSLPSPASLTVAQVAQISWLAVLALALLALPVTLVNDTAKDNAPALAAMAGRVRHVLRLDAIGMRAAALPVWASLTLVSAFAGVLFAMLSPGVGFNKESAALALGLMLAVLLVAAAGRAAEHTVLERHGERSSIVIYPGFALVAVVCVVVSRISGLQPGLVLGTLLAVAPLGAESAEVMGRRKFGKLCAIGAVATLAWVLRTDAVTAASHLGGFAAEVAGVLFTALVVRGAQTIAFEAVPMAFTDGMAVFQWNRWAWAGTAFVGAFGFVLVLLRPSGTTSSLLTRTGYLVALLSVYLVAALAFWAYFRRRLPPVTATRPRPAPGASSPPRTHAGSPRPTPRGPRAPQP